MLGKFVHGRVSQDNRCAAHVERLPKTMCIYPVSFGTHNQVELPALPQVLNSANRRWIRIINCHSPWLWKGHQHIKSLLADSRIVAYREIRVQAPTESLRSNSAAICSEKVAGFSKDSVEFRFLRRLAKAERQWRSKVSIRDEVRGEYLCNSEEA